ncbi:MAG: Holliday junction branch migration protein RuvA [Kiritimatiellia bacterium]|nr:Holliday junction branch migration protein RuvA [Lentisphaerota bacterium]
MIDFLEGVVCEKTPARLVLQVGGVGYEIFISLNGYAGLPAIGAVCRLWVHDYVREDQHLLYGFVGADERRLFNLLLGVSGIGPKIALSALGGMSVRELTAAITGGEVSRLQGISGVGRKTAERIVLELRDKFEATEGLSGAFAAPAEQRLHDAARALVALGHKPAEAQKMVLAVAGGVPEDAGVAELVRLALRR